MVDLPEYSPQGITAQDPQSRVTGADIARQGAPIAQGLQRLGEGFEALSVPLAEEAGREDGAAAAKSVTRDANGNIVVTTPAHMPIFGAAGGVYAHAVQQTAEAGLQNLMRGDMADIAAKHLNDPQGFRTDSASYLQNLRATLPGPLASNVDSFGGGLASQHYAGAVQSKALQDQQAAEKTLIANIADNKSTALAIARQNGVDAPEFVDALKTIHGRYDAMVANPAFGMTKERADLELKQFGDYAQGENVAANIDQQIKTPGGAAAARQYLQDKIENNANLHVTDEQRATLMRIGAARIAYAKEETRAQAAVHAKTVDAIVEQLHSHAMQPDDPRVDQAMQQARDLGDTDTAGHLFAARDAMQRLAAQNNLSDSAMHDLQRTGSPDGKQATNLGRINTTFDGSLTQSAPGHPSPQSAYSFVKSIGGTDNEALMLTSAAASESGLNQLAPHDNNRGFGLFGHNGARLEAMQNFGGDPRSWTTQMRFALSELRSRPESAAVNAAQTPEDLAAAEMHYEQPAGYTKDNPQAGHNYTGRLNTIRRFTELTGKPGIPMSGPPSSNGVAYSQDEIRANPWLLYESVQSTARDTQTKQSWASTMFDGFSAGAKVDQLPNPTTLAAAMQVVNENPTPELQQKFSNFRARMEGNAIAMQAAQMPDADGQRYIERVNAMTSGSSLYDQLVAREAKDAYDYRVNNMKRDPNGESMRRGWTGQDVGPLDMSSGSNMQPGIARRIALAQTIGVHQNNPAQNLFLPGEQDQAKGMWGALPVNSRVALATQIAQAPAAVREATLQSLVSDPETRVLAIAGSVGREAPQVASDIIQGEAQLQANPKLAPKADDFTQAMTKAMPFTDFREERTREALTQSTRAYYARLAANANDTSGDLNQDRLTQAVNAVTGGVVTLKGSKVIAPWRGADQSAFDKAVSLVNDKDMAGAVTANGEPIPADAIKPRWFGGSGGWRLESRGDGTYRVFSGDDTNRRYAMRDITDAHDVPGVFVLDLSSKRAQVEAGRTIAPTPASDEDFYGRRGEQPVQDRLRDLREHRAAGSR